MARDETKLLDRATKLKVSKTLHINRIQANYRLNRLWLQVAWLPNHNHEQLEGGATTQVLIAQMLHPLHQYIWVCKA